MKLTNKKSLIIVICTIFFGLIVSGCAGIATAANPTATVTSYSTTDMSSEISDISSESLSDVNSTVVSMQQVELISSPEETTSSAVAKETKPSMPSAIDFFGHTGKELAKKYGKCTTKSTDAFIMKFDDTPYQIALDSIDDNSGKVYSVEIYGDAKCGSFTDNIKVGMTFKQLEKALNDYTLTTEVDDESGNCQTYFEVQGYSVYAYLSDKNVLIGGNMKIKDKSSSAPVVSEAPEAQQYVIIDHVAQYTSEHKSSSNVYESSYCNQYGLIDGMNEFGILKYTPAVGCWTVMSKDLFKELHSDAPDGYFEAVLKHFNVCEGNSWYFDAKFASTTPYVPYKHGLLQGED